MEFRDLKRQYCLLHSDIDDAIARCIASAHFILGEEVATLESALALAVGVPHCVSCASGTDALVLALDAIGIAAGDAVFVPDFTFFASAEAVARTGATPVLVDVSPVDYNIDPSSLVQALEKVSKEGLLHPRAVVAVDLFGRTANYAALRPILDHYHLLLIEDGAQSFGAVCQEGNACALGDISITSFFPAKPLGCFGDGGALFSRNGVWADTARSLRVHGRGNDKYDNIRLGYNSRLDTLQAAILAAKLPHYLLEERAMAQNAAKHYHQMLQGIKCIERLPLPDDNSQTSAWAQYTIQLTGDTDRRCLQQHLHQQGIPSQVYYPTPLSEQTAFAHLSRYVETPTSHLLSQRVLSLPFGPYITTEEQSQVAAALASF